MKQQDIHLRDPFVLVHDGKYYLYGSRGKTAWGPATGFDVFVSEDLENWSDPIACFEDDGSFWAKKHYWAPEVHPWQGAFYMFASFKGEGMCRGTAILKSASPLGPFEPHSDRCVTPPDWECLDGTLYVDKKGKPWMVFCHEWTQVINGEICAMPLTDDLRAAAGPPRLRMPPGSFLPGKIRRHMLPMVPSSGAIRKARCCVFGPVFPIRAIPRAWQNRIMGKSMEISCNCRRWI